MVAEALTGLIYHRSSGENFSSLIDNFYIVCLRLQSCYFWILVFDY